MESSEAADIVEPVNERLVLARAMLTAPQGQESAWPALAAAGFCALCAVGFAFGTILAPPVTVTHLEQDR